MSAVPFSTSIPVISFSTFSASGVTSYQPLIAAVKAITLALVLSAGAIAYAEAIYLVTRALYLQGRLKRYHPLPTDRNYLSNFGTAFGFIAPCTLYGYLITPDRWVWCWPSLVNLALSTIGYMAMHDTFFYQCHRGFHRNKVLYRALHEAHHEYSHAMNVYSVGYAEVVENFIQVGVPWIVWTAVIHKLGQQQILLLVLPLSLTVFTTLIGHSGYKYDRVFMLFHPLIIPFVFTVGPKYMLTPGDHQVHHSHRRYNFGLFFRTWDRYYGTYKRCEVQVHEVEYWKKFVGSDSKYSSEKQKVGFDLVETAWGF